MQAAVPRSAWPAFPADSLRYSWAATSPEPSMSPATSRSPPVHPTLNPHPYRPGLRQRTHWHILPCGRRLHRPGHRLRDQHPAHRWHLHRRGHLCHLRRQHQRHRGAHPGLHSRLQRRSPLSGTVNFGGYSCFSSTTVSTGSAVLGEEYGLTLVPTNTSSAVGAEGGVSPDAKTSPSPFQSLEAAARSTTALEP